MKFSGYSAAANVPFNATTKTEQTPKQQWWLTKKYPHRDHISFIYVWNIGKYTKPQTVSYFRYYLQFTRFSVFANIPKGRRKENISATDTTNANPCKVAPYTHTYSNFASILFCAEFFFCSSLLRSHRLSKHTHTHTARRCETNFQIFIAAYTPRDNDNRVLFQVISRW